MAEADPIANLSLPSDRYFNRELSWLAFNQRVLEEAMNRAHPLLERLRFLSISGANLDEFFSVRVAGLKGQQLQNVDMRSADGLTPAQQLSAITETTGTLMRAQQKVWGALHGELTQVGVEVIGPSADMDNVCAAWLREHFLTQIFPILTPQALDPAHPFPFIPNQGLSIVFDLERLSDKQPIRELVMIPSSLARFVRVPGEPARYMALEAVIRRFSEDLFPGYRVRNSGVFRIIRDSDIEIEEEAEDLVRYFRSAIKRRRRGRVIRMEIEERIPEPVEEMLQDMLQGHDAIIEEVEGFVGIGDLSGIVDEDRPDLKFEPYAPRFPERIREYGGDCFAAIRAKDIVVHHPYEAFDVVISFLKQAASDPDVVAIKQTLYRAGKQSAIIRALIDAAEAGKSVTAVVELKARFDEEQNLMWADALERAGVQVVYGFIDWKTHAKVSMVVRREGEQFRTYCHFGTGNYHPITAKIYTDLSYFTADPRFGRDAAKLFNFVTGYVEPHGTEMLGISPVDLREKLYERIDAEAEAARQGKPSGIWAKLNQLTDAGMIDRLYAASEAGVEIQLVVRGICNLRPGVQGLSENIRVKSIIGRFLEHSRIYAFANGAPIPGKQTRVYISSADMMERNLDRRVEQLVPVENQTVHDQVLQQVLLANLLDTERSWILQPDGTYERSEPGSKPFNCHRYFMTNPSLSGRGGALEAGDVPKLAFARGAA